MIDLPQDFRFDAVLGTVVQTYPNEWEVDVLFADGGVALRATVIGPRFPEKSTRLRPQYVLSGFFGAREGACYALPIDRDLIQPRGARSGFRYYTEVLHFRVTITDDNQFEIRNLASEDDADAGDVTRILIQEDGGIVRIDTKSVSVEISEKDQRVVVTAPERVEVNTKHAQVNADSATIDADTIKLGGSATEPVVLGNLLKAYVDDFIQNKYNAHKHGSTPTPDQVGVVLPPATLSVVSSSE